MRISALLASTVLACSSVIALPAAHADSAKGATIALIYGIKGDPFYMTMERGAREEAAKLGVKLVADGPSQWNPALQSPIIDAMVARNVDALVVVPNDPQAMIASLQTANTRGIPVVTADTTLGDGDYTKGSVTFPVAGISSDNFAGGKLACTALIKAMGGKGKVYILVSTPNVVSDTKRRDGCKEAIKEAGPGVGLAGVDYTQSNSAIASNDTQAVLQRNPDIAGIFGGNTFSAEGAAAAIKTANLQGAVKIASFDAPQEAINALKDKTIDLVIAQQPALIGATAVKDAFDALESKTVSPKNSFVPFVTITRENVDTQAAQAAIYRTNSGS
ncbi:substrate-binding domain-containing protein [Acidisoma cellulosilytica]|uniref:Substrate-binding domain-containing protein n=1 Tax=Acidisoma cellulosilyticum TaxID=2802395 RepID=A0A963Z455_9PROT|nr:ABC transporter substrate-binding protein [Acidisoma cellulosilyticum]MCB8882279.1 substrate-binding domain-containing protein [Acidisoma cellulosilyticum]